MVILSKGHGELLCMTIYAFFSRLVTVNFSLLVNISKLTIN